MAAQLESSTCIVPALESVPAFPPVAGRLLGIPNTTMFDYEFAVAQHTVNCALATRTLVPEAIPPERLRRFRPRELVQYPGLKEEYVLHGFSPDPSVVDDLGVDVRRTRVVAVTLAIASCAISIFAPRFRQSPTRSPSAGCAATGGSGRLTR